MNSQLEKPRAGCGATLLNAIFLAILCAGLGVGLYALFAGLGSAMHGVANVFRANSDSAQFELACPACGKTNTIDPSVAGIVRCRSCGVGMDAWVRADFGDAHRPPWFLQGFLPAGVTAHTRPLDPSDALVQVWMLAQSRVNEIENPRGGTVLDQRWQRPATTWEQRHGSSQDRCVLLADMLRSLGFDARVVCGMERKASGAWIVVKRDGDEFILPTDFSRASTRHPPLVGLLKVQYQPDIAFDEKTMYFPAKSGQTPERYWRPDQWIETTPDNL